ncbi:hypothetical protein BFJ71_g14333 [Fusarium oxysporum]|nr:hypothetical protein BFJ71_g14333 [Fusarium oxysporum]
MEESKQLDDVCRRQATIPYLRIGILPAWWYRVFYIYTAAMILAVSTLRLDLFAPSEIIDSWEKALLLF